MKYVIAHGARIPALGMGTWTLNGDECVDMVSYALQQGYRHLDTAVRYGNETEVGTGIKASGVPRDEIFLTTKVWPTDLSKDKFAASVSGSLERLQTDYIDLLLVHWPNPEVPLEETITALNLAAEKGQAKYIGVSNFPSALFEQAVKLSARPLIANEVEYHPYLDQSKVYNAAAKAGAALIAYTPLGRGELLGEDKVITAVAKAHNASPAQVVLSWLMQQDKVIPIPRTKNKGRLVENFNSQKLELSGAEMAAISALRAQNRRFVNMDFAPVWDT